MFGLIGAFTTDTEDCDWSTYYIAHPVFDFDLYEEDDEKWGGNIMRKSKCADEIGDYRDDVNWAWGIKNKGKAGEEAEEIIDSVAEEDLVA